MGECQIFKMQLLDTLNYLLLEREGVALGKVVLKLFLSLDNITVVIDHVT